MSNVIATTVAIQGQSASFHDIVADRYFSQDSGRVYCETFEKVFDALEDGRANYGICAIENSLTGSINQVYDLLLERDMHIIGEAYLKVDQCLITLPGAQLSEITEVYSHPVALTQCRAYLDKYLPNARRLEYHDTAGSVTFIKRQNDPSIAAIAAAGAATLHEMSILSASIESNHDSHTRFIVIAPDAATNEQTNKTSLVLRTGHHPGALYQALGAFAQESVNLTKLQSRPIPSEPWKYMFYIDILAGAEETSMQNALSQLKTQDCQYTVLGSYTADDPYRETSRNTVHEQNKSLV